MLVRVLRYVRTHGRNGDVLVMTPEGVWKGGSIKRLPPEKQWDPEDFDSLKGSPWNLRPKATEDVDSLPVAIAVPLAGGRLTPDPVARDSGPRNLYVTKKDVEGHYTVGCPGCIALQTGLPARSHNAECRTMVEQRLAETDEGMARIETARKRKSESAAPVEEGQPVLDDVPDGEAEMHGPSAGDSSVGRIGPLVRSIPADKR